MERRSFLHIIIGGALLVTTGCMQLSGQETKTPQSNKNTSTDGPTNHTVAVKKRVESQTGLERRFYVTNEGNLYYELTCPNGTQKTASGSVTRDEWAAFKQVVVSLDHEELQEKYKCTSRCPQGLPSKHIQVTVDGSTVSTIVEASASIPTNLENLISYITDFEEKIEKPNC